MEFLKPRLTRGSVLKFSPYSWAKLLYLRDIGPTEIGGYGITETDDPLLVTDFHLIKQVATSVSIDFDTKDSIDFVERMTDKGIAPWQYGVFIHTHPGNSSSPSVADEENFQKNFSMSHMAVFFILARGGSSYTRLRYNVGSGTEVVIKSEIDYSVPFNASDFDAWKKEYDEKVTVRKYASIINPAKKVSLDEVLEEHNGNISFFDEDSQSYILYDGMTDAYYDDEEEEISKQNVPGKWDKAIERFLNDKSIIKEH